MPGLAYCSAGVSPAREHPSRRDTRTTNQETAASFENLGTIERPAASEGIQIHSRERLAALCAATDLVFPKSSEGIDMMVRNRITIAAFGVLAIACIAGRADDPRSPKGVTLLGMLSEWQYPGSKFNGAESSDAAVTDISSIKSKAVLTTPDSAEKVVAFYQKKLKVDASGRNLGEKEGERITTNRSVSIQDNSDGRPLKLFIIAINETDSSTTLVVSRSEAEETTHIAWSNFRKLAP